MRASPAILRSLLALLLVLGAGEAPLEARERVPDPHPKLAAKIRARLAKAGVAKGRYGISVFRRGPEPQIVFAEGHLTPLVPASAAKVLTAAAALDLLGPAHRFETLVSVLGDVRDGVLHGDLVVHGSGDPAIQSSYLDESDPRYLVRHLARGVRKAGIRRVTGDVILDEGRLDHEFTHTSWTKEDVRSHYGAGVAGLNLHEGCLQVRVTGASRVGASPTVHFPTTRGPYEYKLEAKTVTGKSTTVGAAFRGKPSRLHVWGKAAPKKHAEMKVPVPDPGAYFGGAFVRVLREEGVSVSGGIRRAKDDTERAGGMVVAQRGTPLGDLLRAMNVHSRNVVASTVFKVAGARVAGRGTWRSGEAAVRQAAEAREMYDGITRIVDGSGLSPDNRTTSALLVQWLSELDNDVLRGPLMYASLATSGKTGTLRRRLRSKDLVGRVHAKTGTLNDFRARALTGYIDGRKGHPGFVFAILLNGRGANTSVIDDIVRLIAATK